MWGCTAYGLGSTNAPTSEETLPASSRNFAWQRLSSMDIPLLVSSARAFAYEGPRRKTAVAAIYHC